MVELVREFTTATGQKHARHDTGLNISGESDVASRLPWVAMD
jgi:hypothetical protein